MVSVNAKLLICVLFFLPYLFFAQEGVIHGKVTNLEYEPIPGVTASTICWEATYSKRNP